MHPRDQHDTSYTNRHLSAAASSLAICVGRFGEEEKERMEKKRKEKKEKGKRDRKIKEEKVGKREK